MARRPQRQPSLRGRVARESMVSNALPVLALGSVSMALAVPRLDGLGRVGDLLTALATVTMIATSWGLVARRLGRRGVLWEAIAVAGLVVIGWLVASNMLAALLPGGMTPANRLLVTALLPLGAVVLLDEEPLLFDPSRRPGPGPMGVAVTCVALALGAVNANLLTERAWLRPEGPALFVERLPVQTLIVANRSDDQGRYRIVVEGTERRIDETVILPARSEGSLSLDLLGSGPAKASLYDLATPDAEPVRTLYLTDRAIAAGEGATPTPSVTGTPEETTGAG